MQFDHHGNKTRDVSWLIGSGCSVRRLVEELANCEVRCANCHRRRTAVAQNWFRVRASVGEQAERVAGGVEHHADFVLGLEVGLGGAVL